MGVNRIGEDRNQQDIAEKVFLNDAEQPEIQILAVFANPADESDPTLTMTLAVTNEEPEDYSSHDSSQEQNEEGYEELDLSDDLRELNSQLDELHGVLDTLEMKNENIQAKLKELIEINNEQKITERLNFSPDSPSSSSS